MRKLTTLEVDILLHCKQQGYKYAALNGHHVRVLNKKPHLVGTLHRYLRDDGVTILGDTLDIPGLFNDVGYGVIKLSDLAKQIILDI